MRHDRHRAARTQDAVDREHEHAAELALRHCAKGVQRLGGHEVEPALLLDREVAHLRAVTVDDDHPPTGPAQTGNAGRHPSGVGPDLLRRALLVLSRERIAAHRHHRDTCS